MKNQRKPKAIELLQAGTKPEQVAEQTGYSIRRVYQIQEEIRKGAKKQEQNQPPTPDAQPSAIEIALQSMPDDALNAQINAQSFKILDSINALHQDALNADSIYSIEVIQSKLKILNTLIENLNNLRPLPPPPDLTELFTDEKTPETSYNEGTDLRTEIDAEQDITTASANDTDFAEILERTADPPKKVD